MAEFLPLCDVLFNVISLAGYFCDVVFDVVMSYALLERGYNKTFAAAISIVVTSLLITQILSLRWYMGVWSSHEAGPGGKAARVPWVPVALHCLQLGVLWRYARLFVPVDLRHVKHQVRDLCMLRLVHACCEAAPMLLLQLHVLLSDAHDAEPADAMDPVRDEPAANKAFAELNVISASLSLFSVCWALASFNKNVRMHNVHRLVLTWLGVIFQFFWRLGTVSARIISLSLYALVYEYWVFLVIGLHWLSMFLWLISPKSVFYGERLSRARRAALSALVACVYVLAYVNLHEHPHRHKMITFYVVMGVENSVLVLASMSARGWRHEPRALPAAAAYLAGLAAAVLYYRYFHVRRLGYLLGENQQGTNSTNASSHNKNGKQCHAADNAAIPGVFNCRFTNPVNGARKKKKPTSFVPPPAAPAPAAPPAAAPSAAAPPAAAAAAFWRRPLPTHGTSSENEGSSVGSRVNIQQKLQEKKQKQLAELRVIEEEIKQGKLAKTTTVPPDEIYSSLQRQPIPRAKTHAEPPPWPSIDLSHPYQNYPICNYPTYTEIKPNYTIDFQNNQNPSSELNDPLQLRRLPSRTYYPDNRYENPQETPLRSNYLALNENRTFNQSPRNELNSPRTYPEPNTTYEIEKSRLPMNYCENRPVDYSSYCSNGNLYSVSAGFDGNPRFPYPGLGGKGKADMMRKMQRCRTPEILLAPHYLEGCKQACCQWNAPLPYNISRKKEDVVAVSSGEESVGDAPRPHSDIDSQISLPRSYTLPREFRYWRRRPRLPHPRLVPSNNSSDGDVDSCDDNDSSASSQPQAGVTSPHPPHAVTSSQPPRRRPHRKHKPETQL